jgi:hypothetical protein
VAKHCFSTKEKSQKQAMHFAYFQIVELWFQPPLETDEETLQQYPDPGQPQVGAMSESAQFEMAVASTQERCFKK